jgi:hypothetical protein
VRPDPDRAWPAPQDGRLQPATLARSTRGLADGAR